MKNGYLETEEDGQFNEAEWGKFKAAGFLTVPLYDRNTLKVSLHFGDETWSGCYLVPANVDETEFHTKALPDVWKKNSVQRAWVTLEDHKSIIHVLMEGETEPLICTKHYN